MLVLEQSHSMLGNNIYNSSGFDKKCRSIYIWLEVENTYNWSSYPEQPGATSGTYSCPLRWKPIAILGTFIEACKVRGHSSVTQCSGGGVYQILQKKALRRCTVQRY